MKFYGEEKVDSCFSRTIDKDGHLKTRIIEIKSINAFNVNLVCRNVFLLSSWLQWFLMSMR